MASADARSAAASSSLVLGHSPLPFPAAALPWLLTSLILALIPLAGRLPVWVTVGFVGCAFWRQAIESRGGGFPSLGWRLALFSGAAAGVFLLGRRNGGGPGDPEALTAFLVSLISLKLLELRAARDFTLLALLGYFLILACFFAGQTLALTLYLGAVVGVNTVALIRCHGTAVLESAGAQRRRAGAFWPTARLAGALVLQALPLAALGFVLFPRLEGRLFRRLDFLGGGRAVTGISEHLAPGSISRLEQSDAAAFRARLGTGEPLPSRSLYWRALTLSFCGRNGLEWTRPAGRPGSSPPPRESAERGTVAQQITLHSHEGNWLIALDRPTAAPPGLAELDPATADLRSRAPPDGAVTYAVHSSMSGAPAWRGEGPPALAPDQRRDCLALPEQLSARAKALAASWREAAEALPTVAAANADAAGGLERNLVALALRFFQDNGFVYTLTPDALPPNKDPLELFLFKRRQGFCEHYAAAFATLMRAAGVPARVVVGYQGGQWNPIGNFYDVRQSDAHAWAEVWQEGRGWKRVDPTSVVAPERLNFGASSFAALSAFGPLSGADRAERARLLQNPPLWLRAWRNTRFAWDTLDQGWNARVVDFGAKDQRGMLRSLGLGWVDWAAGCTALFAGVAAALGGGAAVVRWLLGRRARAESARERGETRETLEAVRLYGRFCGMLARRAGVARAPAEGPLDFAARAGRELPENAGAIAEVTRLYVALRYGRGTGEGETLEALRAAVGGFRVARRTAALA